MWNISMKNYELVVFTQPDRRREVIFRSGQPWRGVWLRDAWKNTDSKASGCPKPVSRYTSFQLFLFRPRPLASTPHTPALLTFHQGINSLSRNNLSFTYEFIYLFFFFLEALSSFSLFKHYIYSICFINSLIPRRGIIVQVPENNILIDMFIEILISIVARTYKQSFVKHKAAWIYSRIKKSLLFPQSSRHLLFLPLAVPYRVVIYPTWSSAPSRCTSSFLPVATLLPPLFLSFRVYCPFQGTIKGPKSSSWPRETLDSLVIASTTKNINDLHKYRVPFSPSPNVDSNINKKNSRFVRLWTIWYVISVCKRDRWKIDRAPSSMTLLHSCIKFWSCFDRRVLCKQISDSQFQTSVWNSNIASML